MAPVFVLVLAASRANNRELLQNRPSLTDLVSREVIETESNEDYRCGWPSVPFARYIKVYGYCQHKASHRVYRVNERTAFALSLEFCPLHIEAFGVTYPVKHVGCKRPEREQYQKL